MTPVLVRRGLMRRAHRGIAGLAAAWLGLAMPDAGADVIELTTGQRIEGAVKEATGTAVVVDVGGREVRIRPERVRSITFETVRREPAATPPAPALPPPPSPTPPPAPALPAPIATALTALGRLQAATTTPMGASDYAALVDEVRREVERSLGDAASDYGDVRQAIGSAIRYHAFAALAGTVYEARGDLASVGRDAVIAECRRLGELITREAGRLGLNPVDPVVVGLIAASEGASALRACASDRIAEAETRARSGR